MHIGLDVGGTKIELAVFDQDLVEVSAWREATPIDDYALFVKTIADMVAERTKAKVMPPARPPLAGAAPSDKFIDEARALLFDQASNSLSVPAWTDI